MVLVCKLLEKDLAALLDLFFVDVEGEQVDANGSGNTFVDDVSRFQFSNPGMA